MTPKNRDLVGRLEDRRLARQQAKREESATVSVLRRENREQGQRIIGLQNRLARFEHPSVHAVEKMLEKSPTLTRADIARALKISGEEANALLVQMASRGYNVRDGVLSNQPTARDVAVEHFYGPDFRFGALSDAHLGNKHALEEQLHEAYAVFQREGIERVYCPGNLIDGEKTYPGQEYEIVVSGVEDVVAYVKHNWPLVPGITTHHVASSSCHEGYYFKSAGILIGKLIERERPDMVYLGLDEADVVMHEGPARPVMRLLHPGGGSSYALSYRPQKIVESYAGGEKPTVLLIGHYHKMSYDIIRSVHTWQAGTLERQTPFMRKRAIEAHLGFWIIELRFTDEGSLRRARSEAFSYYVGRGGRVLRSME